MQSNWVPE